jgi:hypothetical protein
MPPPRQLSFRDLAALYRAVLRANRRALPPPLRALGDGYAADEFRRHLRAKTTPQQWAAFGGAWRDYAQRLALSPGSNDATAASSAAAASDAFSGNLPDDVVASMSREQRQQLEQLRRAAESLARGGGDEGDDGGAGSNKRSN